MLGLHLWLTDAHCSPLDAHHRPKEDLGDKILFAVIIVILVLVAGLMSGSTAY